MYIYMHIKHAVKQMYIHMRFLCWSHVRLLGYVLTNSFAFTFFCGDHFVISFVFIKFVCFFPHATCCCCFKPLCFGSRLPSVASWAFLVASFWGLFTFFWRLHAYNSRLAAVPTMRAVFSSNPYAFWLNSFSYPEQVASTTFVTPWVGFSHDRSSICKFAN